MELREWLIILGLVLVVIITVDGIRRLQRQRRGLRLDISSDIDPNAPPLDPEDIRREEQVNWELPNGGARVVRPERHSGDGLSGDDIDDEPAFAIRARRGDSEHAPAAAAAGAAEDRPHERAPLREHRDSRGPQLSDEHQAFPDPLDAPTSEPLARDSRASAFTEVDAGIDDRVEDKTPEHERRFDRHAADGLDAHDETRDHPDRYEADDDRHDDAWHDDEQEDDFADEAPRRRLSGLKQWARSRIEALDQRKVEMERRREEQSRQQARRRRPQEERAEPRRGRGGGESSAEQGRRSTSDNVPASDRGIDLRHEPGHFDTSGYEPPGSEAFGDLPDDEFRAPESESEPMRGMARHPAVERARRHHVSAGSARHALRDAEEVIVISVNARDEEGFYNPDLLQLVLACGLRYCEEMGVFHRFETESSESPLQFSMLNSLKPGTFQLDEMDEGSLPGVTFLMPLPGARDATMAFEAMVETAMVLVRNLGGELKDENRSVMTAQTIEFARQRVRDFERRWRLHRQAH